MGFTAGQAAFTNPLKGIPHGFLLQPTSIRRNCKFDTSVTQLLLHVRGRGAFRQKNRGVSMAETMRREVHRQMRFLQNALHGPSNISGVDRKCMSHACVQWSVKTSKVLVEQFYLRMG